MTDEEKLKNLPDKAKIMAMIAMANQVPLEILIDKLGVAVSAYRIMGGKDQLDEVKALCFALNLKDGIDMMGGLPQMFARVEEDFKSKEMSERLKGTKNSN